MKPSKSINSLANHDHNGNNINNTQLFGHQNQTISRCQRVSEPTVTSSTTNGAPTSPICRCRVMYLGSSVPHITKDGLQGIQEPLRELYPDAATLSSGNAGIDSWLSVWSNGILIENVDETGREVKRFFKIDALHYCAAVKYAPQVAANQYATMASGSCLTNNNMPKFLPLDSPHARQQNNSNPPIFASILRRTTGVKVLECHAFVCKREAAANALVRCCFHAYADTMYAKQIGADVDGLVNDINNNNNHENNSNTFNNKMIHQTIQPMARKSKSIAALNKADRNDSWQSDGQNDSIATESNHYQSTRAPVDGSSSVSRRKSINENYAFSNCDIKYSQPENSIQKQHKLSKSMHHLNQPTPQIVYNNEIHQNNTSSTSHYNLQDPRLFSPDVPFYNPYASRVPSYPPQQLLENGNRSGTLRSIKSVAAHSIASTLLRSKKHAKEMAQLNQDKIISFHQPNGAMHANSFISPPIPPMFLPDMPNGLITNGSQTMKISSSKPAFDSVPMHFEAMTPKEMKKLLKKSAKHSSKYGDNGLPLLPMQPMPPLPMSLPPPPLRLPTHMINKSGTIGSQSMFSMDMQAPDVPDMASGFPMHHHATGLPMTQSLGPMDDRAQPMAPLKSILVKPNPEFLKSKAGKKWLKQQKEFKKLLPPHLDGLPIIFGPPPLDALEHAQPQDNCTPPAFLPPPQPGLPLMNSSNFCNTQAIYGPSGRASTASTLLRYSPNSQVQDNYSVMGPPLPLDYPPRNIYSNNMMCQPPPSRVQQRMTVGDDPNSLNYLINNTANERQFQLNGQSNRTRNHMVEQSIISLGDENDCEDEVDDSQANGYYYSVDNNANVRPKNNGMGKYERVNYHEREVSDHQDYEQV